MEFSLKMISREQNSYTIPFAALIPKVINKIQGKKRKKKNCMSESDRNASTKGHPEFPDLFMFPVH